VANNFLAHSRGLEALCNIQRTRSPEEAIRGACLNILEVCNISEPPISLNPILTALNIKFNWSKSSSYWNPNEGTASLRLEENLLTIHIHEINARRNWRRTRFSIAHEIIHALIIHILKDPELISTLDATEKAYAELEQVCNIGAAELLMPTAMMRRSLRSIGISPLGLLRLYDKFLVSRESLIWRIGSISPSTSVIRWRKYARHSNEDNCFRVLSCYPPYKKSNGRAWLPKGATTKHISSDIVEVVSKHKNFELREELNVILGKKEWKCEAVGTMFSSRNNDIEQPTLQGFQIPDEKISSWDTDVLTFVSNKGSTGTTSLLSTASSVESL
jgi:hypothetical protein